MQLHFSMKESNSDLCPITQCCHMMQLMILLMDGRVQLFINYMLTSNEKTFLIDVRM